METFAEAKKFFRPSLDDLHDPYLMKDMDRAVERIKKAFAQGENILVHGDYDVDGTTSVALVSSYLLERYPNVTTYIPDRYSEGYGVSYAGIDYAHDNDCTLIIALDCGANLGWPWRRGSPLTIPNREVKPVCADGTAKPGGRVGRRLSLKALIIFMVGAFFMV